jgi:hypothetical protein
MLMPRGGAPHLHHDRGPSELGVDTVLAPLEWVVALLMVGFHRVFTVAGLPPAAGFTWAMSIVGLVIVIQVILIPELGPEAWRQAAGGCGRRDLTSIPG